MNAKYVEKTSLIVYGLCVIKIMEVNYGSFDIDAIPHNDSDHAWSTHMRMISQDSSDSLNIDYTLKITTVEISSQYMKFNYFLKIIFRIF
jgi:hypothetical protein